MIKYHVIDEKHDADLHVFIYDVIWHNIVLSSLGEYSRARTR